MAGGLQLWRFSSSYSYCSPFRVCSFFFRQEEGAAAVDGRQDCTLIELIMVGNPCTSIMPGLVPRNINHWCADDSAALTAWHSVLTRSLT